MIFRVRPLRFEFQALDPISFAPGQAANTFRGAFGQIFRRIASAVDYARVFEPRASGEDRGPSGFADRPRPFVLRAAALDGRRFGATERFALDVNIFDPELAALDYFRQTFAQLCVEGLGLGRPRVELSDAKELPAVECDLAPRRERVEKIRVAFLTPTELKSGGEVLREPRFDALLSRARDRVHGLGSLYQGLSPDETDFRGMSERAGAIRLTACRIAGVHPERRSTRTGQRHGLGGFTGEAEYEGDLTEFLPYLHAAYWTGVGRLTVWGNGMVRAVAVARGVP